MQVSTKNRSQRGGGNGDVGHVAGKLWLGGRGLITRELAATGVSIS